MNLIVSDNERAFVYKYGVYKRILGPGKHSIYGFWGETAILTDAIGQVSFANMNLPVLRKDPAFEAETAFVDIPDDKIAIHFIDGRARQALESGTYAFWNIHEKNTFEIFDMTDPESANSVPSAYFSLIPSDRYRRAQLSDSEVGLLTYNGNFQRMLTRGQYFFWNKNIDVRIVTIDTRLNQQSLTGTRIMTGEKTPFGEIRHRELVLSVLQNDPVFVASTSCVEVPDDKIAIRLIDGRAAQALEPGAYTFWNIYEKNTFALFDTTDPESASSVPVEYIPLVSNKLIRRALVGAGEVGLLSYNGVFQRLLTSGMYFYWNTNTVVEVVTVDMRLQQLEIVGQEILTADKVSLRVNFVCAFRVVDPEAAIVKLKDYRTQLHVLAQLSLREL